MKSKFNFGRVIVTNKIYEQMKDRQFQIFVQTCLWRYVNCDWGDTCDEDKHSNDQALLNGERILAVYIYPATKESIWIITEWDRSVTTVLFPDEY